jgi:GTP-binding protein
VNELLKAVDRVLEARKTRVQTSQLNRIFEQRLRLHHHPLGPKGKPAKFYYLSQVSADPPEFVLFTNIPGSAVHYSYRRFITNTLRSEFGFSGTPIKLHFKVAKGN